ncbi:MAG: DUF1080 domain-containing protein [Saprospiraceae bacterium]|nr:DUF1080 domain-containing protein [Saprospiraceae bacterium]
MQKKIFHIVLVLIPFITTAQDWQPLFNGKDLTGWEKINGSAEYTVENQEIIGTTRTGTPNSFLATEKKYGDFILEMDVWLDPNINSGIQFRSESKEDIMKGRVHGYQFELDPSDRKWSGGIYDEARRGWIYPLSENENGQDAFINGKWNQIRIEAIGPNIKTWINGTQCANLVDDLTLEGIIALQVHSIGSEKDAGRLIRWKNIRILTTDLNSYQTPASTRIPEYNYVLNKLTENEKRKGWKLLWNGEDMSGWSAVSQKTNMKTQWSISNGILSINEGANPIQRADIKTDFEYDNFELIVYFKITEKANSGIKYLLLPEELAKENAIGLEFQILDDNLHPDAKKGKNGNRTLGSLYDLIRADNLTEKSNRHKRFFKNQWNRAKIIINNGHVEHWLNNVKIVEYNRHSQTFRALVEKSKYAEYKDFGQKESGVIVLQDHGDTVHFKNIKIREL